MAKVQYNNTVNLFIDYSNHYSYEKIIGNDKKMVSQMRVY